MPIVHAYRRKGPHTVELFGALCHFTANAEGKQVCNVPEGPGLDLLMEITEGYRLLTAQEALASVAEREPDAPLLDVSPFIITFEGEDGHEKTVDLRKAQRPELLQIMTDNDMPNPHPNSKDETLREKIVAFMAGSA